MKERKERKERKEQLTKSLLDFVIRVSEGRATSETEVQVLPEVARILKGLIFDM